MTALEAWSMVMNSCRPKTADDAKKLKEASGIVLDVIYYAYRMRAKYGTEE